MNPWPKYSRAPLMQAVIEFRLREAISLDAFDKLKDQFSKLQWKFDQIFEFEVKVEIGAVQAAPKQRITGFRFTSPDATQIVAITRQNYSLTISAPYPGWEAFLAAFNKYLIIWRTVVGKKPLGRIGVRYINRFDIHCPPDRVIKIEDYMAFRTTEPDILDEPVRGLIMQVNSGIKSDALQVNLGTSTVESPLIEHIGISLDIDLFRDGVDVPQGDADISAFLELVRKRRTEIFEKCITDEMRKVIS